MSARSARSPANKSKNGATAKAITLSSDDDDDEGPTVRASVSLKPVAAANKASTSKNGSSSTAKRKIEDDDDGDSDDGPVKPAKKRLSTGGDALAPRKKLTKIESESDYQDDDDDVKPRPSNGKQNGKGPKDESDEEDEPVKNVTKAPVKKPTPKKPTASSSSRASTTKAAKAEDEDGEEPKPKAKWTYKPREGPANPGSKEIPEGAPNALGGLTIVFTGELESLSREEAQALVRRYGGKPVGAVSSKTSYVVLGVTELGPKKLEMIKKNKIPTLDEDGFLNLIATRGAKDLDKKYVDKQKEDAEKIKKAAKALAVDPQLSKHALWTVKYAPTSVKELCGNPGVAEKLQKWLDAWPKNLKSKFNKPGADGSGGFRAVLLSGPPGIGKTTTAHLVATLAGYKVIEMNASDTRSKKLLEANLKSTVDNTVLDGFMNGGKLHASHDTDLSDRSVLIMDEVDGTSGGDRGGIGALNALIKKTKVPIICIANDKSLPKMKPLLATTWQLQFKRPTADSIRARLMTIAFREGMKIDKTVADQLVMGTQSDIRQMINILSTWKLKSNALTYDETKRLTDSRDANSLSTPFSLMDKLFGPYAWSANNRDKLSNKLEIYFQEFDVMPLFVQENYLKHKFARAASGSPREIALKKVEITSKAADAISDGDLVDRMIHGTQQHWSLMPVHGMLSTVLPSYHCYGQGGYGWNNGSQQDGMGSARAFPGWFGKNSTQGRLQRLLTDIQIRMRLKVSGDRREIRQSYIPTLFHTLVTPLVENGNDAIEAVIAAMDEYYLTKDEWDGLVDMGIGDNSGEPLLKKIKPATKTAFTRKYNAGDHPIPFHKGTDIVGAKRGAAARDVEQPDLEEAFEVEVAADGDDEEDKKKKAGADDEPDAIKDKLVKAKKPKAPSKAAAKPKKEPK